MASDIELESRLPPNDRDAERAMIGSLLREPPLIDDIAPPTRAADCYCFAHQVIFQAIQVMREKNKPVDVVTLADEIEANGKTADVGGIAYLIDLWDSAPAATNAIHYAAIVRDKSRRREIIQACQETTRRAFEPGEDADELLSEAERRLFAIGRESKLAGAIALGDVATQALDRIWQRAQSGRTVTGIATGWTDLDALTAGAQAGELIIIGARPSTGKTALIASWLCYLAEQRIPSLTFSIEQGRHEIGERLLCAAGSVNSHRTRTGNISDADADSLAGASRDFMASPGLLIDRTEISPREILAETRRAVAKHGIKIVFVDYLQLIRSDDPRLQRHDQVAATTRRLKLMARELNIPVVALAQLNRDIEKDSGGRKPRLSDLKESGSVEQDADCVLFIHKPVDNSDVREIIVGKQRNGPTGEVALKFRGEFMRFENQTMPTPDEWRTEGQS